MCWFGKVSFSSVDLDFVPFLHIMSCCTFFHSYRACFGLFFKINHNFFYCDTCANIGLTAEKRRKIFWKKYNPQFEPRSSFNFYSMRSDWEALRNGSTRRCSRKYIAGKHNEAATGIKQSSSGMYIQTTESKASTDYRDQGWQNPQSNQHPSREMFAC